MIPILILMVECWYSFIFHTDAAAACPKSPFYADVSKQAYMAYKAVLNSIAEVYWSKIKTILKYIL